MLATHRTVALVTQGKLNFQDLFVILEKEFKAHFLFENANASSFLENYESC